MKLVVSKSSPSGGIIIPGSKSHTIRSLCFAGLAEGTSVIRRPLLSDDARSAYNVFGQFGAKTKSFDDGMRYTVEGFAGRPIVPDNVVDVGNSGTTLRFGVMTAALADGWTCFTGDYQIRRRMIGPLVESVNHLGGQGFTTRNNGSAPCCIKGRATGGYTEIDAVTSQYLSSLLAHAPLLEHDTEIKVTRLNEAPYVEITLWWLDKLGIRWERANPMHYFIPGNQMYKAYDMTIPADFSTATFPMVLAAISGKKFTLKNLDLTDPQGDKAVVDILESMGARVTRGDDIIIEGNGLRGMEIDMNAIPDALPAMSVAACFADNETRLVNVPQARLKETDRIAVMAKELTKMGADIEELPDGLIIRPSKLHAAQVSGHDDHRVVMSLALAGLQCEGETVIDTAEAMAVTFPAFADILSSLGGNIRKIED